MDHKNHSPDSMYLQDYKYAHTNVKAPQPGTIYRFGRRTKYAMVGTIIVGSLIALQHHRFSPDLKTSPDTRYTPQSSETQPLDLDFIASIQNIDEHAFKSDSSVTESGHAADAKPSLPSDHHATSKSTRASKGVFKQKQSPDGRQPAKGPAIDNENWITVKIQKGDSLSKIFQRLNLSHKDAITIASKEDTKSLNYLTVGRKLAIRTDFGNNFTGLEYQLNKLKSLVVTRDAQGNLITQAREREPVVRIRDVTAPIQENLFSTAEKLNISNRIISELSSIFRWDIDFARDIQDGDRFSVIFQENHIDGEVMSTGDILAAEFIINGHITRVIRHEDKDGNISYYTPEGKSLKKAFIRNPLEFVKITSGFSHRRFHPKLKIWRAHKGVDYGAPKGTPIMATADGTIEHIGRKRAYGKTIVLDHGHGYSTLYAHMSRYHKGLKNGAKVKQGQVIGYVGSTGLSTGNHLHYEFRVNGKHVNPLAVDLPRSLPIDSEELSNFMAQSEKWIRRLDALQGQSVADNNTQFVIPPSI